MILLILFYLAIGFIIAYVEHSDMDPQPPFEWRHLFISAPVLAFKVGRAFFDWLRKTRW